MNYSTMTERETEIELGCGVEEGISSFSAHDRLLDEGRNMPEKTYTPSMFSLVMAQIKNLYTLAFLIMGIVFCVFDFKGSMPAWIILFLIAAANIAVGFRRDMQDRNAAAEFDNRRADMVHLIRDGKEIECDPTLVVKGDVLVLRKGDFVCADARILSCSTFKMNESIFRHNSVPISKKSDKMDFEGDITDCFNMVYCGTEVVDGEARAAVIATGSATQLSQMSENNSKKLNLHDDFAKNTKIEKILILSSIVFAIAVMLLCSIKSQKAVTGLLAACTTALCILPAPVRLVRMFAMRRKEKNLNKKSVTFSQRDFVYDIGSVEYLVMDKGKMLTDSSLRLEEKVMPDEGALVMAALCSDCTITPTGAEGNDIDAAAVNELYSAGTDLQKLFSDNERVAFKPFDDSRNLMASIHKTGSGYRLIAKGMIEVIPTLCTSINDGEKNIPINGEILHRLETIASDMAEKGLKIRAVAFKDLDTLPQKIDDEISNLTFAAIFGYREVLAPMAAESIKKLEESFVKPIVLTGDGVITAAAVAKQAGLVSSENECADFRELADISDDELRQCADKFKVFANASIKDRIRFVNALSKSGAVTAVAGERMTTPSVSMYSNVSFGKEDEGDFDVSLKRSSFETVANVIGECRRMRSNMAAALCLSLAVGLSEALILLLAAITEDVFSFKAIQMLILNLFVVFVPTLTTALFGHCEYNRQNKKIAFSCAFRGVVGAAVAALAMLIGDYNVSLCTLAFYAVFLSAELNFERLSIKIDKDDTSFVLLSILGIAIVVAGFVSGTWGLFSGNGIWYAFLCALAGSVLVMIAEKVKLGRRANG